MEMRILRGAIFPLFALFNQVAYAFLPCTVLGNDRCVRVQNNCPSTIWPALSMQVGSLPPTYDGFSLSNRGHVDYHFPNNVTYLQVWGRTMCTTLGTFECVTGDCGPSVQCDGVHNVSLPISMAEVWPNPVGVEKYDVTLFNGFNLPIKITPSVITPTIFASSVMNSPKILDNLPCSPVGGCGYTLTDVNVCPRELRFLPGGEMEGCFHPCTIYKTPEYCCTGQYASPQTCLSTPDAASYKDVFKAACPNARTSPFDTPMGTCVGVHPLHVFYTVTFC